MLNFSLVAEALTGLIYHRPSGENSNFQLSSAKDYSFNFLRMNTVLEKDLTAVQTLCRILFVALRLLAIL